MYLLGCSDSVNEQCAGRYAAASEVPLAHRTNQHTSYVLTDLLVSFLFVGSRMKIPKWGSRMGKWITK